MVDRFLNSVTMILTKGIEEYKTRLRSDQQRVEKTKKLLKILNNCIDNPRTEYEVSSVLIYEVFGKREFPDGFLLRKDDSLTLYISFHEDGTHLLNENEYKNFIRTL